MEDINLTIVAAEEAVGATPLNHPDRVTILANLRSQLDNRFQRTGDVRDLNRAIEVGEMAVDATRLDHPDRGSPLSNLGTLLCERFELTGAMDDLKRAIEVSEMAVAVTALDHINRSAWLTNLGNRLGTRFRWVKQMKDIDRAIEVASLAVEITPEEHQNRAGRLTNLGNMLGRRFDEIREMKDLDRAVDAARQAVYASPRGHPDRFGCLANLGSQLGTRYEQAGSMEDLNQAVDAAELALEAAPLFGDRRAVVLTGLANCLGMRFKRIGEQEDLDLAIQFSHEAVLALPPGHPKRGAWLDHFGTWLMTRFERTGSKGDISSAIEVGEIALEATPPGRPERAAVLANLASRLGRRFERFGGINDINRAVQVAESALDASPPGLSNRVSCRANLASWLSLRYKQTRDMGDLNRAIQLTEEATKAVSPGYPDRAGWLSNLATYLEVRFEQTKKRDDIKLAFIALKEGWNCQNAPPSTRITLARRASVVLSDQSNWDESSELLEEAVGLLLTVSPRSLQHSDKQHMLGQFAGLASMAAAMALNAGKEPYHALKLLELGRGVIAGLLLEMRIDISTLRQRYPKSAVEFVSLRGELDTSVSGSQAVFAFDEEGASHSLESRAKRRREAEERLEEVLKEIRSKPGFESFLLPPTEEELRAVAAPGQVVVINATSYRCDAFLIRPDRPVEVLELPKLNLKDVEHKTMSFGRGSPFDLRQALEWLWDVAACPILDALGFTQPPTDDNWPHIWWVPTGKLSKLPFHAAGRRFGNSNNTVLDRVMSSYSSSIKALIYGRQIPNADVSKKALLITVPGSGLPFAEYEVSMLEKLCPSLGLYPVTPAAVRDEILTHLRDCMIFHFASHGKSHPFEPSSSHLLLSKGDSLTVAQLRDCKLQENSPFLAYLSACSTKVNAAERLVDEEIHLVSACQLAGFRHVVGTLWEVSDKHCAGVAKDLYETIRDKGMTDSAVYRGLHQATKRLRDRGVAVRQDADKHHTQIGRDGTGDGKVGIQESDNQPNGKVTRVENSDHEQQKGENNAGTQGQTVRANEGGGLEGRNRRPQNSVDIGRDDKFDAAVHKRGMEVEDVAYMNPRLKNRLEWVPYIHFGI